MCCHSLCTCILLVCKVFVVFKIWKKSQSLKLYTRKEMHVLPSCINIKWTIECTYESVISNYKHFCHLRYRYLELNGASTWAFTESAHPDYSLSKLTVQGGAHLAFLSHTSLQTPVQVSSGRVVSDKTGQGKMGLIDNICLWLSCISWY